MTQTIDGEAAAGGEHRSLRTPPFMRAGFTLLEVMIVVVILGILAALVVPKIISRPDEARVIAAKQDIASFMQALKLYRLDNLRYPSTEQGLQALVQKPVALPLPPNWKTGGFISGPPQKTWGKFLIIIESRPPRGKEVCRAAAA